MTLCDLMDCSLPWVSPSMGFSRPEYWSGLPFPSPGIFWTKGSNPGLPQCRQMLLLSEPPGKPRLVSVQYAIGGQWRNSSWKNEEMEPKWKRCWVVHVIGDWSQVWCCKQQYCVRTWNARSMNQGKLEVVKQEMSRVNINILGISELTCARISQFSSVTQSYPHHCDPMDCGTPGFPVYHYLLEFTQTHVHWVSDAIQPSHTLSSPSPPAFNLSQHQRLFKSVSSSH